MFDLINALHWKPTIGDPTLLGWTTVYAYFCAGLLSLATAWRVQKIFHDRHSQRHRFIWGMLAFGMFALGMNKQLDLQTLLTEMVRLLAYQQGWYEQRHDIQLLFIVMLIGTGGVALLALAWLLRGAWKQYWLLLLGSAALGRFVVVRAATFYGVQLPELSQFTGRIQLNWLLELIAACVIVLAALLNLFQHQNE